MRCLLSVGVIVGLAVPARADDVLPLPRVMAAAIRQNPDLEQTSIDLTLATAAYQRALGVGDTHLGFIAAANVLHVNGLSAVDKNDQVEMQLALTGSRLLSTGGTLSVQAGSVRSSFATGVDTGAVVGYTTSALVTLTQPLLRGAGDPELTTPIRATRFARDAAALAREARARELAARVAAAYWQVALAREQRDVRKTSLELANATLTYTESLVRVGKFPQSELLAVQQVQALREANVLAAEQVVYERSLELRQLASLEIGPKAIALETEPLPPVAPVPLDLDAILASTYEHSAELAGLAALERSATAGVAAAENAAQSRLDLAVTAGPEATGSTLGKSVTSAATLGGYGISANLTFDRAVERRTERATVVDANTRRTRIKIEDRAARARIAVAVTRAVQRAKTALATIKLADLAIELAKQNIEAEKNKFELKNSSMFEVLRRQDELEEAKLRRASAVADYLGARADIDAATGDILKTFAIVVK